MFLHQQVYKRERFQFQFKERKCSADLKTEGNSLALRAMACLNMQNTLAQLA